MTRRADPSLRQDTLPAWPRLLRVAQAAAYCGLAAATFRAHCPVAPSELGVGVLVWDRARLDAWIDSLPARESGKTRKSDAALRLDAQQGPRAPLTPPPPLPPLDASAARKAAALAAVTASTERRRRD